MSFRPCSISQIFGFIPSQATLTPSCKQHLCCIPGRYQSKSSFIFPFLLVFLYKSCSTTKKALVALIVIAIVTLLLSEWLLTYDQSLSFYASPTRFWQFIIGGLLAISKISAPKQTLSQVLSLIGLAILILVIFTFDEKTPFPGFMAIPVTLATALVIYARSERGIMGWVLSNPISNFFGNISYSFYLWHWPVIIFYKIYLFDHFVEFGKFEKLSVLIISIVLATLTYRFIEIPFKKVKSTSTSYKPILISLSVTLGIALTTLGSSYFQKTRFTAQTNCYLHTRPSSQLLILVIHASST